MKKALIILFAVFISLSLLGCGNPDEDYCMATDIEGLYICQKTLTSYFDTTIVLKLYYDKDDSYDVKEVFDYFEETTEMYHKYFDKYHEYEGINNVYTINHSESPVIIDDELYEAIEYALIEENVIIKESVPLFNIALGPVLEIWHDARESTSCDTSLEIGISYCPVPRDAIDGIEFSTNPDDISLDPDNMTIEFLQPNMSIDLGGFTKGYLTDIISKHLNELEITYLLNNGNSNVISGGSNPVREDGLFYIGLQEPSTDFALTSEIFMYIKIPEDMAVVTSGNSQRFFKGLDDSEVYHHIIDPTTNYPGGYSMAITVIHPDSAKADILSTALYLLPLDDAMDLVNSISDMEAVWYLYDSTVIYSDGFDQYIYTP